MQSLKRHIADCEVNVEHNKKDLVKSRDRTEKETKNMEDQKIKLEKNDHDLA